MTFVLYEACRALGAGRKLDCGVLKKTRWSVGNALDVFETEPRVTVVNELSPLRELRKRGIGAAGTAGVARTTVCVVRFLLGLGTDTTRGLALTCETPVLGVLERTVVLGALVKTPVLVPLEITLVLGVLEKTPLLRPLEKTTESAKRPSVPESDRKWLF